jgi:hypothetical protein
MANSQPGYYRGYHIIDTVAPDDETPVVAVSHRGGVVEWITLEDKTVEAGYAEARASIDEWLDAK